MFKHIVVAFITPSVKLKSFNTGLEFAKKFNADLTVVDCVYQHPPKFHFFETKSDKEATRNLRKKAEKAMKRFEELAKKSKIPTKTRVVLTDNIAHWVIDYVSTHEIDLLIMDHPHLSSFEEAFYEDIIHAIHHEARLPVLTLK